MDRFWEKTEERGNCLVWTGGVRPDGYGVFWVPTPEGPSRGSMQSADRVAYERVHGPIPKGNGYHGTVVMHSCDNRLCVKPDHLLLGSQKDNMRDALKKGRFVFNRPKGAAHHATKLTAALVRSIRKRARHETYKSIAEDLGISASTVGNVVAGRTWGHVA